MSRGGRGGFGGPRGGMMGSHKIPFEIDAEMELDMYSRLNGDGKPEEADATQSLFPPYPGGVPRAPPVTATERKLVQIYREIVAEKHASPAYTGPPGSLKALCGKRTAAEFNPFEDMPSYGKKYQRRDFRLADPKKRKWQAPHLFPKELWEHIGYNPDANVDEQPRKKLALNKRTNLDKLARFDDDAEGGAVNGEVEDDEEANMNEDEEDQPEVPQDDEFEEDEDDDANDYNAEQYFDGGEDDYDEPGGDEYGGGDDGEKNEEDLEYCPYKRDESKDTFRPNQERAIRRGYIVPGAEMGRESLFCQFAIQGGALSIESEGYELGR